MGSKGQVTLCPCVETTDQCVHPYTGRGHDTSAPGWECVVITAPVSALHSAIYRLHLLSAPQAGAGWRLQLHSFEQFLHGLNAQNILLRIINNNTTRRGAGGMCCDAECIISSSLHHVCTTERTFLHLGSTKCLSQCVSVLAVGVLRKFVSVINPASVLGRNSSNFISSPQLWSSLVSTGVSEGEIKACQCNE